MRKATSTLVVAATVAAVGMTPAAALISGQGAAMRSAIEEANPLERVACWRYGWRGWGLYPGCFYAPVYASPVYVAPPVYAAPAYAPPRRCWVDGQWRLC